ncbi:MAG: NHLP leader peptide family RiPP precursor [Verrucomicrobiae bacterium]
MNKQSYEKIISKCWANPAFKQQLMADPAGTLRAEGIEFPECLKVSAVENNAEQFTFVIPAQPAELTDDILEGIAGGILPDLR